MKTAWLCAAVSTLFMPGSGHDPVTEAPTFLPGCYRLWEKSGYGRLPTETSAWLVREQGGDGLSLVDWPASGRYAEAAWPRGRPWPEGRVAIVHTHPDRLSEEPSTTSAGGGEGDYGAAKQAGLPVYVVSRHAIWRLTPEPLAPGRNPVRIAGDGWWDRSEPRRCGFRSAARVKKCKSPLDSWNSGGDTSFIDMGGSFEGRTLPHVFRSFGVFLLAAAIPGGPPPTFQTMGHGHLFQVDQSGIKGEVSFLDTGTADHGLIISGRATGLDPTQSYFSRIYDKGSVPGGPAACEPANPHHLTGAQMAVGFWEVEPDGTGTLFVSKPGASYASMSEIGALSIRMVVGPPPGRYELEACAEVVAIPSDEGRRLAGEIGSPGSSPAP
jgi:hypothetical protein